MLIGGNAMKTQRYKIDVDCAVCAEKMEEAAKRTAGVDDAVVNFMMLNMKVKFADGADTREVMDRVLENCRKIDEDCKIYF
jgi:cation transport ATPase